jgi:hypothetical protein
MCSHFAIPFQMDLMGFTRSSCSINNIRINEILKTIIYQFEFLPYFFCEQEIYLNVL